MHRNVLIDTCAKICHYAQCHTFGWEDEDVDGDWETIFQCTTYTIACFISQHVDDGVEFSVPYNDGKDWQYVIDDICRRNFKQQTIEWWKRRMEVIVSYYEDETETGD
jgi:hypothetical protein